MAAGGFRGVYPMLYAFFDAAGRLDRAAMCAQVDYCVASGAHGVAALGLGTEVRKLTPLERRQVMQWAAEDLRGRLPLAITVFGATPAEQIAFVHAAAERGADWVILQPPQPVSGQAVSPPTEDQLVDFFGAVADASTLPVAIQNAASCPSASRSTGFRTRLGRCPSANRPSIDTGESVASIPSSLQPSTWAMLWKSGP